MSEPARGVVVAHGGLAAALVQEVERISGELDRLAPVSNEGADRFEIERRVTEAAGSGPVVLFVDMPCGSCFLAAMRFSRERQDVRVVTGVNLPMLLDFVHHAALPPAEGAARAADKGGESIRQV